MSKFKATIEAAKFAGSAAALFGPGIAFTIMGGMFATINKDLESQNKVLKDKIETLEKGKKPGFIKS